MYGGMGKARMELVDRRQGRLRTVGRLAGTRNGGDGWDALWRGRDLLLWRRTVRREVRGIVWDHDWDRGLKH